MHILRQIERTIALLLSLIGVYQIYFADLRLGLALSVIAIFAYIPNEINIADEITRKYWKKTNKREIRGTIITKKESKQNERRKIL